MKKLACGDFLNIRLGLVADLHGRYDPALGGILRGVALILVAGDIVTPGVLEELGRIAPLRSVRGNNDHEPSLRALPEFALVEAADHRILVTHDRADRRLSRELAHYRPDILVVGHSHRPLVERRDGLLVVNPGSAGPRRFRLPRSAGVLTVRRGRAPEVQLWDLENGTPLEI